MYRLYVKRTSNKRARGISVTIDNYQEGFEIAQRMLNSWWGTNGIYEWIKIKDLTIGKYITTFR